MFEEIIEIEEIGEVETYDLEIDSEFHNFYANDICVSNSHSVGYAYIAMQTLYLKTYYPEEFYCSLLNNPKTSGSLERQKEWLTKTIASAMAKGVRVVPPSRKSNWDCAITNDKEITLGFSMVKGMGEIAHEELTSLLKINKKNLENITMAAFFSLPFSKFNKTAFNACLKSGVFDGWSSSREYLLNLKTKKKKKTDPNQALLFDIDTIQYGSKIDTVKFPPTQDLQKRFDFEEVCGFDLIFINRVAKINEAIINKSQENSKHIDPITSFSESGDYYFFLHDIKYLETKRKAEYLEMKVGDGITTTKIRAFGELAKRLKPELQKNAVYLSQFMKNDKGFINFKKSAKFKMIVEPSGDKLLTTT